MIENLISPSPQMRASFSAEEILEITGGRLAQGLMPDDVGGISTDTRDFQEGSWFVALPGNRFDGHDFIGDAFAGGAIGCIVAERGSYPIASTSFPLIAVDDTLGALESLARNWRRRINPKVVAVTGRRDKPISPVTMLLSQMLARKFGDKLCFMPPTTLVSTGEALMTILGINEDTRCFLTELAPFSLEELRMVARALQPNIVVFTTDGFEHLSGTMSDIVEAHGEVLANLDPRYRVAFVEEPHGNTLKSFIGYYPGRVDLFDMSKFEIIDRTADPFTFRVDDCDQVFSMKRQFAGYLQHIWCAVKTGRELGIDAADIAETLSRCNL
ncbi:MAG TPA: Mur ligase domain-containing protein [Candidatus Obscuribacterales bacterium]